LTVGIVDFEKFVCQMMIYLDC